MAEVLIVPPGAIQPADRKLLREAGVVVVETEDPSRCVFVKATDLISASDMLWAAMDAVRVQHSYSDKNAERLAHNLLGLVCEATGRPSA